MCQRHCYRLSLLLVVLALAVHSAACDDSPAATTPDATHSMDTADLCDPYVQGIHTSTASGAYTVTVLEANPAPPDKGMNVFELALTDSSGAAVDAGVTLVVHPWMPAHDHGSTDITATASGADGKYTAADVNLLMPGAWELHMQITVDADPAPATVHTAVFTFCVEG